MDSQIHAAERTAEHSFAAVVAESTGEFAINPLLQRFSTARRRQGASGPPPRSAWRRPVIAGVNIDHECAAAGVAHRANRIPWRAVELVDGDQERQAAVFEEDRRKAVLQIGSRPRRSALMAPRN